VSPYNAFAVKSKCKWLAIVFSLLSTDAIGQMKSGTAIVVFFSEQRVILAGDSRVVLVGGTPSSRDDEYMVFTFNNRFLYAAAGLIGHDYLPGEIGIPWDAGKEAKHLAEKIRTDAPNGVSVLANGWSEWMKTTVDTELAKNPAQILSHLHSSVIASAVFAGRDHNGVLSAYTVSLICACSVALKFAIAQVEAQSPSADHLPVGFLGIGGPVFNELLDGRIDRAKAEQRSWSIAFPKNNSLFHDVGVTIRSLEYIIRYSGSEEVGGPIDVAVLDRTGKIRWIQHKKNCHG
jgi:hypothetical protein